MNDLMGLQGFSLDGINVTFSELCVEPIQFRFPRSKKKRIRAKWTKNQNNWKDRPKIVRMGNTILAHPSYRLAINQMVDEANKIKKNIIRDNPRPKRETMAEMRQNMPGLINL